MKFLTLSIFFSIAIGYSQTAEYGKLTNKAEYKIYLTKIGDTLKVGDTLTIGIPTSDLGFTYISQGGQRVSNTLSDKKVLVDKLKTYGSKNSGYKLYAQFKGYGLLPVLIDYDTALELGEIKNSNIKLTKEQAIAKLKEAKELLDLEVITKTDYEKLKTELTPLILN
ncbi:hypothetical protein [Aequorivita antarctica]|uniref:SHOCT domain-containing protein n=1 Tax=Aequorivita antarctica TaxID=153266 RepID=A0A5C6YZM3_9FLAO|nr:hypothetical protein [Aequorivita antarctica]TXD73179.1 hypothetical protein ESU54_08565 [Aequorivita antarctica]SRX74937.1 hypothetical protein AEQU3_01924 [Aequorivita antarctica]